MSHYKDPYQPTSIMESNKGFFRGSPGSLFSFVASFPTTTRCWCARELPFHMSWWLWFEELQNGRGAGVSWWSWWCCWQKVICLFLTWYVNKYLIYIWHVDTIYDLYIYMCIHALYIYTLFQTLSNWLLLRLFGQCNQHFRESVSAIHRLARMTVLKLWKSTKHPSPMFLESRESTICVLTAPCQHLQWIFFIWLFSYWLDFQAAG